MTGRVVFVERVERITRRDDRQVVQPVATVFEVNDTGAIAAWRDYWDTTMAEGSSEPDCAVDPVPMFIAGFATPLFSRNGSDSR